MVAILLSTGLRLAELVALRWDDVSLPGSVLRVRAKGHRGRTVPLDPAAARALEALRDVTLQRERALTGAVVSSGEGRPLTVRTVQRQLRLLASAAGLPAALAHHDAIRRAFVAAYLADHRGDLCGLAAILGHASVAPLAAYLPGRGAPPRATPASPPPRSPRTSSARAT